MNWFENLPKRCPPADAEPCKGDFYRLLKSKNVSSSDFYPQQKLQPAKAFVGVGIDECIVMAISLFKSKEDAEKRLKLPKFRHSLIARVSLEPKDGLSISKLVVSKLSEDKLPEAGYSYDVDTHETIMVNLPVKDHGLFTEIMNKFGWACVF